MNYKTVTFSEGTEEANEVDQEVNGTLDQAELAVQTNTSAQMFTNSGMVITE